MFVHQDLQYDIYLSQSDECMVVENEDDIFIVKPYSSSIIDRLLYTDEVLITANFIC